MKFCLGCQRTLPLTAFYTRTVNGKTYPQSRCRPCYIKNRKVTCGWKPSTPESAQRRQTRYAAKVRRQIIDGVTLRCARSFFFCHRKQDKKLGREFDLDVDWICEKIAQPCVYCGDQMARRTLDRVDNSFGHLKTNCVTACVRCNLIRGNMPHTAWMLLVPAVKGAYEGGAFGEWMPRRLMQHKE